LLTGTNGGFGKLDPTKGVLPEAGGMFWGCTSLTTIPEYLFSGTNGFLTSIKSSVGTPMSGSFEGVFAGCTAL